jgi:hypothetical protein
VSVNPKKPAVRPEGFEPPTLGFEGRSSDQLAQSEAELSVSLSPHFGTLPTTRIPAQRPGSATHGAILAPFRHRASWGRA